MDPNSRYNYFHQNPNPLVNGQTLYNQPANIMQTENDFGSISLDRKYNNPNAVPMVNHNFYQMDNNQPRSSGPPRTNAKGIYENSQSSIPDVYSLAQSNAENYPINPDFQLQPHLTGLLPQQPKKIPEPYSVEKNFSRGTIAANMNTNYFSVKPPYPEPKIIEYDTEETSTESSPQHTSSLYSESTDQDSESIQPIKHAYPPPINPPNINCHVTEELKSSNKQFPVPSEFADLNLNKEDYTDDHHSILHNAYNQDDDDIEDIPLPPGFSDQNEIKQTKENLESRLNDYNVRQKQQINYYSNKNQIEQAESNNEYSSPPKDYLFSSRQNTNQPVSHFNNTSYFNQSYNNTTQPNMFDSRTETSQNTSIFSQPFSSHESPVTKQSEESSQSIKLNQPEVITQSAVPESAPPIDTKQQFTDSTIPNDKSGLNTSALQASISQANNNPTSADNTFVQNEQNLHSNESLSRFSSSNSFKPVASELLNNVQLKTSHQTTTEVSRPTSVHSNNSTTSSGIPGIIPSSSPLNKTTQLNQNVSYQHTQIDYTTTIQKPSSDIETFVSSSTISPAPGDDLVNQKTKLENIDLVNKCPVDNNAVFGDTSKLVSLPDYQSNSFHTSNITSQIATNTQQSLGDTNKPNVANSTIFDKQSLNSPVNEELQQANSETTVMQQRSSNTSGYFNSSSVNNQSFYQQHSSVDPSSRSSSVKTEDFSSQQYSTDNSFPLSDETFANIKDGTQTSDLYKYDNSVTTSDVRKPSISDELKTNPERNFSNFASEANSSLVFNQHQTTDNNLVEKSNVTVSDNQSAPMSASTIIAASSSSGSKSIQSFFSQPNASCNEFVKLPVDSSSSTNFSSEAPSKELLNQTTSIQPKEIDSEPLNQLVSSKVQPVSNQAHVSAFQNMSTQMNAMSIQSPGVFNPQTNQLPIHSNLVQPPGNQFTSDNQQIRSSVPYQTANQFPSQLFDNQFKPIGPTPVQSTNNRFAPQPLNSKPIQNVTSVPPTANQYQPQPFQSQSTPSFIQPLQPGIPQIPPQQLSNQPVPTKMAPIPPPAHQDSSQVFNNQFKPIGMPPVQTTNNRYPPQSTNSQTIPNTVLPTQPAALQFPPQQLNNQSKLTEMPPLRPAANHYPPQPLNSQPPSIVPPIQPGSTLFSQSFSSQPKYVSPTANQYPSTFNNQERTTGMPPIPPSSGSVYPPRPTPNQQTNSISTTQPVVNQYPSQPFSNEAKPNGMLQSANMTAQPTFSQYTSQPMTETKSILPNNNLLYGQTNPPQPLNNQWPTQASTNQIAQPPVGQPPLTAKYPSQINPMLSQPPLQNSQYNPTNITAMPPTLPSGYNQQTQQQMLPPSYNNQLQGNSQLQSAYPTQNVQLTSKGFSQPNNMGYSGQTAYQQSAVGQAQQGYYNQDRNPSVVQQGFASSWGYDTVDLLKTRDILPGDGVQPPDIKLPQGYANCDNCSPDIFRCTLNKFPVSKTLLDKSRLPLGILIHPYKDLSRLTVIQCDTITRCRNCRSYINPFVQFIDNAHWKCNLCYRVNDLPGEFQIDPYTKTLGDPSRRPEIQNATIEYIASQDYMVRPPQPALYLFLLDVSRTATLTGYLEIVCDRILNKIMSNDIPGDTRTQIGFITYDSAVHFYQIAASNDGAKPKQLVVSDISDIFLPLPDGLMVTLQENKSAIKDLLTSLPEQYNETYNTGCALGAALQAAFKILAPRGGRVTVFQASLPNCGPGSLEPRDSGAANTSDRVQHMAPSTDFYKKLALECSAEQIAVDMFFISSQYLDIASISGISKFSAGCIHSFPQFDNKSPTVVTRFINCFDRYLSRKIGFEALLRLRCTRGVAIHSFHGNFFVRSSDLLMLPNVNPDSAYGMQLSIEDSLDGVPVVCFQAALLYTSSQAERRIRVHTMCVPVTENLNDIFQNADQQAITCLIAKMAVDRSTEKSLLDAREAFVNAISDSLSAYKLGCNSVGGSGSMLAPVSLKVFPLYILATLKHSAFRTSQPTKLDDRIFSMCQMKSLPLYSLMQFIYPDLYPIHTLEEQPKINYEKLVEVPIPPLLQLSAERIDSNGIYLMDDSETLTIFIGRRSSDLLIQKLFGYVNFNAMPEMIAQVPEVDSKSSYLLRTFVSYLQHFKPYPLPIEIIKENGPHKLRFFSHLIEDKFESTISYYEFLQRISQQIR
ncbi:protein transport protein Sec24B [Adelges cooleyi]|uniref:protein transport protein Sec24B n=1 Tax=Adelges cooleyi TaxID=133065 RepID=UPI00217F7E90|nr:protein transport protein Sec24B [Adelges cooleyi]